MNCRKNDVQGEKNSYIGSENPVVKRLSKTKKPIILKQIMGMLKLKKGEKHKMTNNCQRKTLGKKEKGKVQGESKCMKEWILHNSVTGVNH